MGKISEIIADELGVKKSQVDSTIKLIDDGNTIPFIARYRKEATGGLSDEQLRNLGERLTYLRNLEERKQEVIKSIDSQGKLTDEIVKNLEQSKTLADVEDIYRPYKQKKRTRATIAKEKGLEELAKIILAQDSSVDIDEVAKSFINEEKGVNAEEDARSGALDIIAEAISDEPKYRKQIKQICYREGFITTKAAKPEEKSSYEMYYDFAEKVNRIPSHRILAINRGEKEEFLKVKIEKPTEKILELIKNKNAIILLNKIDKEDKMNDENKKIASLNKKTIKISTKTKNGLNELYDAITEMFDFEEIEKGEETVITNIRHKNQISMAIKNVINAIKTIDENMPIDIIAIYIKQILEDLSKITGDNVSEDIINEIFSKFCLGK